jgi:hypothetical protein
MGFCCLSSPTEENLEKGEAERSPKLTPTQRADNIQFILRRRFSLLTLVTLVISIFPLAAVDWKAGRSKVSITPEGPLWMAGYAARNRPSEGVAQDLFAKALALEDESGYVAVLVTMDVLGFPAEFIERIANRISESTGLNRSQILFNASHTHAGPVIGSNLRIAYEMTEAQSKDVADYTSRLEDKLVRLVQDAMQERQPVRVNYGETEASFAVNRRVQTSEGVVIGANRSGPVDHRVPFLVVDSEARQLVALVFGYSCHCTSLRGNNYFFHGDYAGVAQVWLEERYSDSVALFVTGTAGDANPYPRGVIELAEEHGAELAKAVDQALTGPLEPVTGRLMTALDTVQVRFQQLPTRSEWESRLKESNLYRRKHAEFFLSLLEEQGSIPQEYPYPIQLWGFGENLLLVGLAGEVVVDYGIRLRREFSRKKLWVAGYSNDVFAYIPSARILEEGGYEAVDSMIYYGQPGPFDPSVEEIIVEKVHRMHKRLASAPGGNYEQ